MDPRTQDKTGSTNALDRTVGLIWARLARLVKAPDPEQYARTLQVGGPQRMVVRPPMI